jgi:hypothetical protein
LSSAALGEAKLSDAIASKSKTKGVNFDDWIKPGGESHRLNRPGTEGNADRLTVCKGEKENRTRFGRHGSIQKER